MSRRPSVLIIANPDMILGVERAGIPARAGFRVHWFGWWKPQTDMLARSEWLSGVTSPPAMRRGGRFLYPIVRPASLYATFLALQPCVVHMHYALCDWAQARVVSRLHPLVVTVMGGDIEPRQGFRGEWAEPTEYLLKHADVVTAKSDHMERRLHEIGVNPERIARITWGMDLEQFRPGLDVSDLRSRLNLRDDDLVFFCARSSIPNSNKRVVLTAFANARKTLGGRGTLLVSEHNRNPEYTTSLRALALELGVTKHVRFVGEIPLREMPAFLNLAEAVISVPGTDGMPQTLYQAMACATYPVVSNIPATKELTDMGCEVLVTNVGDSDSLARAIVWVGEHRDLARQLGLGNRERVAGVADKRVQDAALLKIYHQLQLHAGRWQAVGSLLGSRAGL